MSAHIAPAEAVIVAGGFGTRLAPLTARHPKHLLNVGGVPFLEHQISKLAAAGVGHIVLATSYRADLFEPVLGDGHRWGVRLAYVQEQEPLGTAGAIRNVADALDGDPDGAVVVLNGDILSGHDLGRQLDDFARPRDGRRIDVSLHLVEVPDARAFGCVPTDGAGRVTGFEEKSDRPVTHQVNAGCYVFRRSVIDSIPRDTVVSVERETFPGLVAGGRLLVGYPENAYWRDVGTPEALIAASADLVMGRFVSPALATPHNGALCAGSASVADDATVSEGSVVAGGVAVGARSVVSGSVVMEGANIGTDAVVRNSAIGPGAVVGNRARVMGATLGDEARVRPGACVPSGSRVDCGATV